MTTPRSARAQVNEMLAAIAAAHPEDAVQLTAILDAANGIDAAALIRVYYADLDRADRTPRGMLYLHIGMLAGLIQRAADTSAYPVH